MPSTSGSDTESSEEGVGEDLDEGSEENMNVYQADEGSEEDMNRDQADDDAIIVDDEEGSGASQGKRASPVDVDTESDDDGAGAGAAVKTKTKRASKPKPPPGHHRGGTPQ